jgi:hypothetical protein
MGNNNSIEIEEKSNGIFQVIAKDIPDYPISYLRLCWDFVKKKYCIAEDCDSEDKFLKRKILVVGMNLPGLDKIYEQSFYLSSGLNSIESLEKFFQKELVKDDKGADADIWIPFSGFGYPNDVKDYNSDIKLLKTNFDCFERGPNCLYGRFGNKEPNLMQISYCLGGKFWENNIEIINDLGFNIKKLPSIISFFRSKIPCIFNYKKWSNIECSIYLNKYIASALPYNYSPHLLLYKNKMLRFYKPNEYFEWKNIKFDYRIIYILKQKGLIKFTTLGGKADLPYERSFTADYWNVYLQHLNKLYTEENKFFIDNILPIINEMIPIFPNKYEKILKEKEDVSYVIEEYEENIEEKEVKILITKGTSDNPYDKRDEAGIGEYYRRGKQIVKKNK